MNLNTLPLPLEEAIYNRLPLNLKLLSWHCKPKDMPAFAAYLEGKHENIETKATMLWFQDYTGIPEIVNLAAKRKALADLGIDPKIIYAKIPTHLVFDHSVRTENSLVSNLRKELEMNHSRIRIAKWAKNLGITVVPPNKGVIHQINFEKLVPVFDNEGRPIFGKGTDSHTPMVNALGVLAWGIGGGESQLVFDGERIGMKIPKVFAINLTGKLRPGVSSSDLAFYLKKVMRDANVTGAFVEVIGDGVDTLPLPARGTISNIAAEFGSRTVIFGIDQKTVDFLALSERNAGVEKRAKAYGLWRTKENEATAVYTKIIDVDLSLVSIGVNGPHEPHLWTDLKKMPTHISDVFSKNNIISDKTFFVPGVGLKEQVPDGALLLASIASCTHTSNPDSILRAALFMKKAHQKGLTVKPWVKTAFAAGSKVADYYLEALELTPYIKAMGFDISAHGCGACIGQSGGLNSIGYQLLDQGLTPTSIVSANRNYAGRQDAEISLSFLASPELIVAYALAGRIDVDIETYDFGYGITLKDLTSTEEEIYEALQVITKEMYISAYSNLFVGSDKYEEISHINTDLYDWPESVLVKQPPFFVGITPNPNPVLPIHNAQVLAMFGDNFSTDAISPAGEPIQIPAVMDYLKSQGVTDKNNILSLGGYRSNDEIVAAMTFSNPTNQNLMVSKKGGWTMYHPTGDIMSIYDAAKHYRENNTAQIVIAGKNYGCGSSRVMAATGPWMLGVKVIIAESFEAIHRSNLWQNGIVPFCFPADYNIESLRLTGNETWNIPLNEISHESKNVKANFKRENGTIVKILLKVMLESNQEFDFLIHGGAMQKQLREFAASVSVK